MAATNLSRLLAASIALTAIGCASAPSRFYTLESTAADAGASPMTEPVLVGPVTVPSSVDRPEIVIQVTPNRVALEEFNRWAGPLNESIARTVAENLSVILANPRVASGFIANFDPQYRVTLDVQRFESVPGSAAVVDAIWVVKRTKGDTVQSGRTTAQEVPAGASFDELAAAHSRALAQVSQDIARAIRLDAAQKR